MSEPYAGPAPVPAGGGDAGAATPSLRPGTRPFKPPSSKRQQITAAEAIEIYKLRPVPGKGGQLRRGSMLHCKSIAPKYGVTPKTIRDVWSGRSWAKTTRHLWTEEEVRRRGAGEPEGDEGDDNLGMSQGAATRVPGAVGMNPYQSDLGGLHASSLMANPFGGGVANLQGNFGNPGAWLPQGQSAGLQQQYLSNSMGANFGGYNYMQGGGGGGNCGISAGFLDMTANGGAGMGHVGQAGNMGLQNMSNMRTTASIGNGSLQNNTFPLQMTGHGGGALNLSGNLNNNHGINPGVSMGMNNINASQQHPNGLGGMAGVGGGLQAVSSGAMAMGNLGGVGAGVGMQPMNMASGVVSGMAGGLWGGVAGGMAPGMSNEMGYFGVTGLAGSNPSNATLTAAPVPHQSAVANPQNQQPQPPPPQFAPPSQGPQVQQQGGGNGIVGGSAGMPAAGGGGTGQLLGLPP